MFEKDKEYKVGIVGSRTFYNYDLLKNTMDKLSSLLKISHVVSGGANGADKLGEQWAKENNIPTIIYEPEWNKYGKRAGFLRNKQIIEESNCVIAFWDSVSKGTLSSINLTKEYGKPIKIIYF
jgi:hypothetical protein